MSKTESGYLFGLSQPENRGSGSLLQGVCCHGRQKASLKKGIRTSAQRNLIEVDNQKTEFVDAMP